jgi:hypothetical protein
MKVSIALASGLLLLLGSACCQSEKNKYTQEVASAVSTATNNAPKNFGQGTASVTIDSVTYDLEPGFCQVKDEVTYPERTAQQIKDYDFYRPPGSEILTGKQKINIMLMEKKGKYPSFITIGSYYDGQLGEKETMTDVYGYMFSWKDIGCNLITHNPKDPGYELNCTYGSSKVNYTKIEETSKYNYRISGTFELAYDCVKGQLRFTNGTFSNIPIIFTSMEERKLVNRK